MPPSHFPQLHTPGNRQTCAYGPTSQPCINCGVGDRVSILPVTLRQTDLTCDPSAVDYYVLGAVFSAPHDYPLNPDSTLLSTDASRSRHNVRILDNLQRRGGAILDEKVQRRHRSLLSQPLSCSVLPNVGISEELDFHQPVCESTPACLA